jgi:hypothetical protein
MMTKDDVDKFARKRPFEPFEVRLVGGKRYRFKSVEEFLVGRTTLVAVERGDVQLISIGLIETIGPWTSGGRRRPRRPRRGPA